MRDQEPMKPEGRCQRQEERQQGWNSRLAILASGGLGFLVLTGLLILVGPFSVVSQVSVLLHTLGGLLVTLPLSWYVLRHWWQYRKNPWSHNLVLGYLAGGAVLICVVSGIFLTAEAVFGKRISYTWDALHILTTFAILAFAVPHVLLLALRDRRARATSHHTAAEPWPAANHATRALSLVAVGLALIVVASLAYRPLPKQNSFPADYSFRYGEDRPFAPSLATTANNKPIDETLLAGSFSCGTSGCHEEIVQEWTPSAHRYAAMDKAFQKIQINMATQNGPESTRYCGGCHDPISLFAGTKNLFTDVEQLSSLRGYQEGVSCLACHSIRQVDVKGNANYVIAAPARYMFEREYDRRPKRTTRLLRDFLIRAYPRQHIRDLSKRMFKSPEYCAACHKQFVDQEVNNVGWVQLQNQYDNWRQSRWNHPRNPAKTIECRECHMPLVASRDPAAGDSADYNRNARDGKHRSHRFIGANQFMPALLKLPGWEKHVKLTEQWLQGSLEVPEIASKWREGRAVHLELLAPPTLKRGEEVELRIILTSNKVGHDFPTGPLDIIQSWLEVVVTDEQGRVFFSQGTVNDKGFIAPGSFMFKAEPVDQYGNLIDRHNLWEMVGVRYRRSLFPGFSDTAIARFSVRDGSRHVKVRARLRYRKIDQYLLNFMFGEVAGITSPITDLASAEALIAVEGYERSTGSLRAGR